MAFTTKLWGSSLKSSRNPKRKISPLSSPLPAWQEVTQLNIPDGTGLARAEVSRIRFFSGPNPPDPDPTTNMGAFTFSTPQVFSVFIKVDGLGTPPSLHGTLITASVLSSDDENSVALKVSSAINLVASLSCTAAPAGGDVVITNTAQQRIFQTIYISSQLDYFTVTRITEGRTANEYISGRSFTINTPSVSNYVWTNVDNDDPGIVGAVGIPIALPDPTLTKVQLAAKIATALNANGYTATSDSTGAVVVRPQQAGAVTDAANVDLPNLTLAILQQGRN